MSVIRIITRIMPLDENNMPIESIPLDGVAASRKIEVTELTEPHSGQKYRIEKFQEIHCDQPEETVKCGNKTFSNKLEEVPGFIQLKESNAQINLYNKYLQLSLPKVISLTNGNEGSNPLTVSVVKNKINTKSKKHMLRNKMLVTKGVEELNNNKGNNNGSTTFLSLFKPKYPFYIKKKLTNIIKYKRKRSNCVYSLEPKIIKNLIAHEDLNSFEPSTNVTEKRIDNFEYCIETSSVNNLASNVIPILSHTEVNPIMPLNNAINHELLELNNTATTTSKSVCSLESKTLIAESEKPPFDQFMDITPKNTKAISAVKNNFPYSSPINTIGGRSLLKNNYVKISLQKDALPSNLKKTFPEIESNGISKSLNDNNAAEEINEKLPYSTKGLKDIASNCTNDLNVHNSHSSIFNSSKPEVANSKDAVILVPLDMYIRSQQGNGDAKTDYLLSKVKDPISSCVFLPHDHIPDHPADKAAVTHSSNSVIAEMNKSIMNDCSNYSSSKDSDLSNIPLQNDYILKQSAVESNKANTNYSNDVQMDRSNYSTTKDGQSLANLLDPLNKYFVGNKCLLCGFISKEKKNSGRRHLATHLKTRNFQCNICGKCFKTPNTLHSHRTLIHDSMKEFVCDDCGQIFSRRCNLRNHVNRTHNLNRKHICSICGKHFSCLRYLKEHLRIHTGEKPYKCTVCDQAFRTNEALKTHSGRHNPERRYVCSICNKSYNRKMFLMEHMNTHQGSPSYKCEICGKAFNFKSNLIQHKLVHSDTRKHSCETCGMKFKLPHHLKSHLTTHEPK